MEKKAAGHLIIFSGPSGVGKGAIRKKLVANKRIKYFYSISYTTRKMRPGEINGKEYNFVSPKEFQTMIKNNAFLEWAKFSHAYYGTARDNIIKNLKDGINVLLEIDVQGAEQIMRQAEWQKYLLTIFISPPSLTELSNRLNLRETDDPKTINQRLLVAKNEIEKKHLYKYHVVNDNLDRVVNEIEEIILKAR